VRREDALLMGLMGGEGCYPCTDGGSLATLPYLTAPCSLSAAIMHLACVALCLPLLLPALRCCHAWCCVPGALCLLYSGLLWVLPPISSSQSRVELLSSPWHEPFAACRCSPEWPLLS